MATGGTMRLDAGIVRNDVVPHLGERRLDELDRRLLERTYAHLLAAGGKGGRPLAPKSVRNVHGLVSPSSVSYEWRRVLPTAPVPPIRFHDLRHTHASLLDPGVPIKTISERLGAHHDRQTGESSDATSSV